MKCVSHFTHAKNGASFHASVVLQTKLNMHFVHLHRIYHHCNLACEQSSVLNLMQVYQQKFDLQDYSWYFKEPKWSLQYIFDLLNAFYPQQARNLAPFLHVYFARVFWKMAQGIIIILLDTQLILHHLSAKLYSLTLKYLEHCI